MKKRSSLLKVFLYPLFTTFIVAVFLLTFSVNVYASGTSLPYFVSDNVGVYNSWYSPSFDSVVSSVISSVSLSGSNITNTSNYIVFPISYNSSRNRLTILIFFDPYVDTNFSNDTSYQNFNFTSSNVNVKTPYNKCINFQLSLSDFSTPTKNLDNTTSANLLGSTSSYTLSVGSAKIYYPVLLVGNQNLKDSSGNYSVISNIIPPVVPDTGHAQSPMDNIPTFVPPVGMHPQSSPTVPSYTFPTLGTRPLWDSSQPFDSLFNIVQWGFGFSYDLLTGILQNIIDWATFFGNLIVWIYEQIWNYFTFYIDWLYRIFEYLFSPIYNFLKALFHEGDNVISLADLLYILYVRFDSFADTIFQDSWFTTFWDNFADGIEDALNGFHNIVLFFDKLILLGTVNNEFTISNLVKALFVPDTAEVTAALMGHDNFGFYNTGHAVAQKMDYIKNTLSTVTPQKQFYIPSTTYHGVTIGGFYLDFSWYDDYKLYGDLLISTFLTIGFIYWVCLNMSNFIRGQSSVGNDLHRLEK